jgi:hypothetical protein
MTNQRIAATFDRVAELLAQQGASPHRARAWHDGAQGVRDHDREMTDVFRDHGRVGLEAVPHIGPRLSAVIIELIKTGSCAALDRLSGHPVRTLERIPGLGRKLAERVHRELGIETLEARSGRARWPARAHDGFGPRRIAAPKDAGYTPREPDAEHRPITPRRRASCRDHRRYRAAACGRRFADAHTAPVQPAARGVAARDAPRSRRLVVHGAVRTPHSRTSRPHRRLSSHFHERYRPITGDDRHRMARSARLRVVRGGSTSARPYAEPMRELHTRPDEA